MPLNPGAPGAVGAPVAPVAPDAVLLSPTALGRALLWLVLAALLAALAGCYVAPDDRTKAQVRLVNATRAYTTLDLYVDGSLRQGAVPYGGSAAYTEVDPEDNESSITTAGSATPLLSFTPAVSKNQHYAILAFGKAGAVRQVLVDENQAEPASGRTGLRIINAAPDAGNLDVYLTASADALPNAVAVLAGAAYGEVSAPLDVIGGTWRLRVTAAANKNDLRLDVADIALPVGQQAVLVLTPAAGGGLLVDALLLKQRDAIQPAAGSHARVRAVNGVAGGATVTASAGGVQLLTSAPASAGAYQFVAAGSPAVAISVGGNSLAAPAATLTAGRDATLLVYGAAGSPQAAWLEDDNQAPAAAGTLRIRLVNATAGLGTPVTLTVNGAPIGSGGVAAGAAGSYTEIAASTAATLAAAAGGSTLVTVGNQPLEAGGVYSVFVIGAPGATSAIIRNDRQ